MNLSIVIPVFAGEHTLTPLVNRIIGVFDDKTDYEIILVFDQGEDNSWEVIKDLKMKFPDRVLGIRLVKNFGQHKALICGFNETRGDKVVTLDEDMQYYPNEIEKLLVEYTRKGADIVYGIPEKSNHYGIRNVLSKCLHVILSLTIKDLGSKISSLRMINGELARRIAKQEHSYIFLDALIAQETKKISYAVVKHMPRINGVSSWTAKKLWWHFIKIMIHYSFFSIKRHNPDPMIEFQNCIEERL